MKNLFAGNLPFSATEEELKELFGQYGEVQSINLILDRQTGRPRGFAFVEMGDEAADKAVEALNGQLFAGRRLQISEARPMEERPPREERSFRPRRDGDFGDRPFRHRFDDEEGENGERRRPFRPHRDGDFGDRPYRPRRDFGDRPYRPRRGEGSEEGGERRPFRPHRDGDFGDRPYRPRRNFGDRPFRPRRDDDFGGRPFRPRRPFRKDGQEGPDSGNSEGSASEN